MGAFTNGNKAITIGAGGIIASIFLAGWAASERVSSAETKSAQQLSDIRSDLRDVMTEFRLTREGTRRELDRIDESVKSVWRTLRPTAPFPQPDK